MRTEEIRAREVVTNVSEKTREARLRWLGHVDGKTGEDVVMRTWKMDEGGHRRIGRPNQTVGRTRRLKRFASW